MLKLVHKDVCLTRFFCSFIDKDKTFCPFYVLDYALYFYFHLIFIFDLSKLSNVPNFIYCVINVIAF